MLTILSYAVSSRFPVSITSRTVSAIFSAADINESTISFCPGDDLPSVNRTTSRLSPTVSDMNSAASRPVVTVSFIDTKLRPHSGRSLPSRQSGAPFSSSRLMCEMASRLNIPLMMTPSIPPSANPSIAPSGVLLGCLCPVEYLAGRVLPYRRVHIAPEGALYPCAQVYCSTP